MELVRARGDPLQGARGVGSIGRSAFHHHDVSQACLSHAAKLVEHDSVVGPLALGLDPRQHQVEAAVGLYLGGDAVGGRSPHA